MLKGEKGGIIAWLALFISIVSLIISFMTYTIVIGRQSLNVNVEDLHKATDVLRNETANALNRLEGLIRKSQKSKENHALKKDEPHSTEKKQATPQTKTKERK